MEQDRALLIRLGALGDTLHASSVARALKERNRSMEVEFLAVRGAEPLFELLPEVARVHTLSFRNLPLGTHPGWRRLRRSLAGTAYRVVFLMETDPRFRPLLDPLRAEQKIALADLLRPDGEENEAPVPLLYQRALWDAGILPVSRPVPPRLTVRPGDRQRASSLLEPLGVAPGAPVVGLQAGNSFRARKPWRGRVKRADIRSWPEASWSAFVSGMHQALPDLSFVLLGAGTDRAVNRRLAQRARSRTGGHLRLLDTAGSTDLPTLAAVLERLSLLVSTDTGTIHMAAAVGTPYLGLYGPTRHRQTCPFPDPDLAGRVVRRALPCQPCYGTPRQKTCRENRCMQAITAEDVVGEALGLLAHTDAAVPGRNPRGGRG